MRRWDDCCEDSRGKRNLHTTPNQRSLKHCAAAKAPCMRQLNKQNGEGATYNNKESGGCLNGTQHTNQQEQETTVCWIDATRGCQPRDHFYRQIWIQLLRLKWSRGQNARPKSSTSRWQATRSKHHSFVYGEQFSTPCSSRHVSEGDDKRPLRQVYHPSFISHQSRTHHIRFRQCTCTQQSWWLFKAPNHPFRWLTAYASFLNIVEYSFWRLLESWIQKIPCSSTGATVRTAQRGEAGDFISTCWAR